MIAFQTLISTMNKSKFDFLNSMNPSKNFILVNQGFTYEKTFMKFGKYSGLIVNSPIYGLSRSRNLVINLCDSEFALFADDDMEYVDNLEEIITSNFQKNLNIDILAFKVYGIEKKFKNYSKVVKKINFLTSLRISSVQIAFRVKSIKHNLKFDESFGAGSTFYLGEENIFLFDALRKGLKIKFIPIVIGKVHINKSSWFKGYNKRYFQSKGAAFYRMSNNYWFLLSLQFLIRKFHLYFKETNIFLALYYMIGGKNEYLKISKITNN